MSRHVGVRTVNALAVSGTASFQYDHHWEKVDDRQNELGYKSLFMTVQPISGKERKLTLVFHLGKSIAAMSFGIAL